MCNVCGCGDSQIEGHQHDHEHHHHQEHAHHGHSHGEHQIVEGMTSQPVVIHHHYHHQGDVHHHVHYDAQPENHQQHPVVDHQPQMSQQGDLHYGKGEAEVHVSGVSQRQLLTLEQDILGKNNHLAAHNREHFNANKQLVLNLVSSPGSGKTTLLTETLNQLKHQHACAVIEGDQQTSNDADRIRATEVPAIQVNTGKGCHLDAKMIHDAYHQLAMNEPECCLSRMSAIWYVLLVLILVKPAKW